MAKFDAPELVSPKRDAREYVTVPDEDLFEMSHPDIIINGRVFGPGKHFVEKDLATEITRLVDVFRRSQVRLLQPKQDKKALGSVDRYGSGKRVGGQNADPESPELS